MFDVDFIYESKILPNVKAGDGCGAFSECRRFFGGIAAAL